MENVLEEAEDWAIKYLAGIDLVINDAEAQQLTKNFQNEVRELIEESNDYSKKSVEEELAILEELIEVLKQAKTKEAELFDEKQNLTQALMTIMTSKLVAR